MRGHSARLAGRAALIVAALITVGCDRVTKHVAATMLAGTPGHSYLANTVWVGYVENPGAFLSLGAGLPPAARTGFFTIATGIALVALVILAIRRRSNALARLGLTLFVAGGASNWIDRLVRGSVVDFLNIGIGPVRTGIFNVADVAIMLGAGIFVLAEFRKDRKPEAETADSA
jgi:signal peptidase II